jgi:transaldolase
MSNPIQKLHELGQSLWYDNIERRLLSNGGLQNMIESGEIRGVTSNPSIFKKAISRSNDYDGQLEELMSDGLSAEEILEKLSVTDIRAATDLFRPLYEAMAGGDGFVSLEVNPHLAKDTSATVTEARRLWEAVDRPNLMVKIPATVEGIPAIRQSIAGGINVNITLIFSRNRYLDVIGAYFAGLEDRLEAGLSIEQIASVASFFVSRVDTKVDTWLEAIIRNEGPAARIAHGLLGKIAVDNARLAYSDFGEMHRSDRFRSLMAEGARPQRPLWASTSTKNLAYPDTKYVEELIGADTVNTVPQETLDAYRDHGDPMVRIDENLAGAYQDLKELEEVGISLDQATAELEQEGVDAFASAYDSLIETIKMRMREYGRI